MSKKVTEPPAKATFNDANKKSACVLVYSNNIRVTFCLMLVSLRVSIFRVLWRFFGRNTASIRSLPHHKHKDENGNVHKKQADVKGTILNYFIARFSFFEEQTALGDRHTPFVFEICDDRTKNSTTDEDVSKKCFQIYALQPTSALPGGALRQKKTRPSNFQNAKLLHTPCFLSRGARPKKYCRKKSPLITLPHTMPQ